jgi:hypothetical protein
MGDACLEQTVAAFALWQGAAWSAGHFAFGAAPGGDSESDSDQKCHRAADVTPGSGMVREHKCSNHSEV